MSATNAWRASSRESPQAAARWPRVTAEQPFCVPLIDQETGEVPTPSTRSFSDDRPQVYQKAAAEDGWKRCLAFFAST